jgi:hypothetical protein
MLPFRQVSKLALLFLVCASPWLRAQELTFLGGTLKTGNGGSSNMWQVDYRQNFYEYFSGSFAYINEGHIPGHHRDGNALQLWGNLPFDNGKLAVSFGAGAYYFYDTQFSPLGGSADVHGTAPIYSLAATAYFSDRWYCRLLVNRIAPAHEIQSTSIALGVGFWFGRDLKPVPGKLGDAPAMKDYVTENELTAFGGQSVVNSFLSEQAKAFALEYRRGLAPHLDWTATAIYEGDPKIIRRNGLAAQLWAVNTFFNDTVFVGAGIGPYLFIDHKHPVTGQKIPATMAPLVSLTAGRQITEHWVVRLTWDRVITANSRDSDIFLLGLGYRWR